VAALAVAEHPAHLHHIQLEVDDQVAGERVAKIAKAKAPSLAQQPSRARCVRQRAALCIALAERRAVARGEHPLVLGFERRARSVVFEQLDELGR
jgi:hypothetical protein